MRYLRLKVFIVFGVLLLLLIGISSCQTAAVEETSPPEPPEPEVITEIEYVEVTVIVEPTPLPPEPTEEPPPPPDHSRQYGDLGDGFHGDNYDVGHGPNTWCARCHSPQNWDPAAFQGPPPSCFSCKFPTDDEVRIAEGNPFIEEEDWVGIQCDTCHVLDEEGVVTEGIAWFNPIKMVYEAVNTPTELCEKCHVTTTGNAFGSAVDHKITLGGSAHLNYGGFLGETAPPTYCTDCHNPHNQVAKQCEDCHTIDTASHAKGKYAAMPSLTCMACHDASGAEVGPHPDEEMGGIWVTQLTTMGRGGPSTEAIVSHSIVYEVPCDRCHFEENPWGLTVYDAEGEIPSEDDSGGGPPG